MTTKNTYNPEDIESLLMTKTFKELLPEEKQFVMQHIDSKEEYSLLRTTLLAIKKSSENDDLIEAHPKTKDNLMLLMESKKNRGAWFSLNGLWTFLFPTDVFFTRKPGFQLASFALLLAFGLFIGNKVLDINQNNLAINKTVIKKNEAKVEAKPLVKEKQQITTEGDELEEKLNIKVPQSAKEPNIIEIKEEVVAFNEEDAFLKDVITDIEAEEEQEVSSFTNTPAMSGAAADKLYLDDTQEEVADEFEISANQNRIVTSKAKKESRSYDVVTVTTESLSNKMLESDNKERSQNDTQSQSLADDEAIIDLLYTTL